MTDIPRDIEYWQNLESLDNDKLIPNDEEILIYQEHCMNGDPLLLGETKQLIHLVHDAVDLHPSGLYDITFQCDWMKLGEMFKGKQPWGTIIGDGAINLCGLELVDVLRPLCNTLAIRVFDEWVHEWHYATHFPTEFPDAETTYYTRPGCQIVVWNF